METGQSRSSPREPHVWKGVEAQRAVEGSYSQLALFPSELMRRKTVNQWKWRALAGGGRFTQGVTSHNAALQMHSTPDT